MEAWHQNYILICAQSKLWKNRYLFFCRNSLAKKKNENGSDIQKKRYKKVVFVVIFLNNLAKKVRKKSVSFIHFWFLQNVCVYLCVYVCVFLCQIAKIQKSATKKKKENTVWKKPEKKSEKGKKKKLHKRTHKHTCEKMFSFN